MAILATNNTAGADTIQLLAGTYAFDPAMAGSESLGSPNASVGDLDITDDLTLTGAGMLQTTIDAVSIDRVLQTHSPAIVRVEHLTLVGGHATSNENGGGFYNSQTTVSNNTGEQGAGIYHFSGRSLTISNSTISGNSATAEGGGLFVKQATTLINVTIANNTAPAGAGVFLETGGPAYVVTMTNTLAANTGVNFGGSVGSRAQQRLFSGGGNLVSDTSAAAVLTQPSDQNNVSPLIGSLQDNGGAFTINATTGAITVANSAALDFETTPSFGLTVEVTDGGGLQDTDTVTINLTNTNEAPTMNPATFNLAENSLNGTAVGSATAGDLDVGDTRTFAITAGNSGGAFAINAATGAITVANSAALDFETTPSFGLTVEVTDAGGLQDTATITVNLTNVNEAPTANDATFNVVENSSNGTSVGTATGSDPDAGDSWQWSLIGGNTGGAFAIDSSTGEITITNSNALDFESQPQFDLLVEVRDAGGLAAPAAANVTILLGDLDETSPPPPPPPLPSPPPISNVSPPLTGSGPITQPGTTDNNDGLVAEPPAADGEPTPVITKTSAMDNLAVPPPIAPVAPPVSGPIDNPPLSVPFVTPVVVVTPATELPGTTPPVLIAALTTTVRDIVRVTESNLRELVATESQAVMALTFDSVQRLKFDNEDLSFLVSPHYLDELKSVDRNLNSEIAAPKLAVGTAIVTSTTLSVGYIVWMLRGGYLLASVLSTLPVWHHVDPLPVLAALDDDDESLETMIERGEGPMINDQ